MPLAVGPGAGAATTPTVVLHLDFEQDALAPGSVVHDASGVARGVVVTNRGALTVVEGSTGRGVRYPCPTCGRALVEVADSTVLDPGTAPFTITADVRMTRTESARSMNVVQKGYYSQAGGQYKLQVDNGRPSCVVNSSRGRVVVVASASSANVADGAWHEVACSRTATEVVVLVDGVARARRASPAGSVANTAPVRIGGKDVTSSDNDQYRAALDDVTISVGAVG
ncbi:LamG-like jellyroll fold domain-containing protein [Nocardioides abyssi]|uniref:LamG domain-containing protein n=1 Tax=Nocardioides abyssi TaxID=3058370 RepID=A0ABT8ET13_9ACTN|nr:LamG-like jellyroll fold domain-containing protein [Nocardioides abyssi]MDN4161308.1 LamG domain-containing protein [Nocardioides abyssi]